MLSSLGYAVTARMFAFTASEGPLTANVSVPLSRPSYVGSMGRVEALSSVGSGANVAAGFLPNAFRMLVSSPPDLTVPNSLRHRRERAERSMNALRACTLALLGLAALVYSSRLSPSLNRANIIVREAVRHTRNGRKHGEKYDRPHAVSLQHVGLHVTRRSAHATISKRESFLCSVDGSMPRTSAARDLFPPSEPRTHVM